jgi:adenine deaminase
MEHAKRVGLIRAARGDTVVDLVLRGARVLNVFSGELLQVPVAIDGGYVVGFEERESRAREDCGGGVLVPGLIDAHVHIESSMVTVPRFAEAVVPRGTTAVVTDAHELANVLGCAGIEYVLLSPNGIPLDVFLMLPSCVPSTPLETAGAELDPDDLAPYMGHPHVLGLGEVMDEPGVLHADRFVLEKIEQADDHRVDGHAVGLRGRELATYIAAGIHSDHEATTLEEGLERLRLGMHVMIREGTAAKNLDALLTLCRGPGAERCMFCTDDRHPHDLLERGGIDELVRRAIQAGLDPVTAVRLATLYPAGYFGLRRLGAIGPGRQADLVLVDGLADFRIRKVWKRGVPVAEEGRPLHDWGSAGIEPPPSAFRIRWDGTASLAVPAVEGALRVIDVVPDQVVTREVRLSPRVSDGRVVADVARDLLKLACVERHRATGNVGVGFVRGFGLERGALASSVAHDSHNVVVVGTNDDDMVAAVEAIREAGGGLAVVEAGVRRAFLPLPVAGLLSTAPLPEVAAGVRELVVAAGKLGCTLRDPFMTLSFLALPVIPELKLTDRGLVDVRASEVVPLFSPS